MAVSREASRRAKTFFVLELELMLSKNHGKTVFFSGATAVRKSWFGALQLELQSPQQPTL